MSSIKYGTDSNTLSYVEHNMSELISIPIDFEVDGIFSVSAEDLHKFIVSIMEKKFLSKTVWKKALKYNKDGDGMLFDNANGYYSAMIEFLGFGLHLYYNFSKNVTFANIINEEQLYEHIDNSWNYFRKESRETITSLLTYPENTRMVKLNKKIFWSTLEISIKEDQHQFVLDAKGSVAMSLFYKTKIAFVQMEDDIVIGLLVLDIDKKKNIYNIDIVIVDKNFQNKGYGKLMVKWAVDYLREAGSKRLLIGVNRTNIGAKKVYINAGFKPKSVYDGGMELQMIL